MSAGVFSDSGLESSVSATLTVLTWPLGTACTNRLQPPVPAQRPRGSCCTPHPAGKGGRPSSLIHRRGEFLNEVPPEVVLEAVYSCAGQHVPWRFPQAGSEGSKVMQLITLELVKDAELQLALLCRKYC